MKKEYTTYLLARLPMGMSMFGHGLIRLTKLSAFSNGMVAEFSKSFLPLSLVMFFSYALPFLEFAAGLLLLVGLFTRFACILGAMIIVALIFGSSLLEQWNNIFSQIVYGAYFALLFQYADYNYYSVDRLMKK
jgi:thiosulfate dehydrogenase [quinone] large subunit